MKMEHTEPATTKIRLGRRIYKWKFSTTNFQNIDFKELLRSNKGNHSLEHPQGDICGMEELVNLADALSEQHRCGQYLELYIQNRSSFPIQLSKQTAQKMAKTCYLPPGGKKKIEVLYPPRRSCSMWGIKYQQILPFPYGWAKLRDNPN